MLRVIDTHAHLDFEAFDGDRSVLIKRLADNNIGVINPATDLESNDKIDRLSKSNPWVWGALGLHPTDISSQLIIQLPKILDQWEKILKNNSKIVAIGEIGLDYYHQASNASQQKAALREMLTFAKSHDLPVIFHCRDAYGDLVTVLADYPDIKGVIHCFSGNLKQAEAFLELGMYISFTAIIGYPKNEELRQVVANLPANKIMIETDSPFLAPQNRRGERNDPGEVLEVAKVVASLSDRELAEVLSQTTKNALNLFNISV